MVIAKTTFKGQVLIPVELRRKYHIHKGSRLAVIDGDGQIILKPMPKDPIKEGLGFLNKFKGGSPLRALVEDRQWEIKRDEEKFRRFRRSG